MKNQFDLRDKSIIVLGDSHLTSVFDQEIFELLIKVISEHDVIILNGDIWDGERCTYEEFLKGWNNLQIELVKKEVIYITGNHDLEMWMPNSGFKQLYKSINIKTRTRNYHVLHGDEYLPRWYDKLYAIPINRWILLKLYKVLNYHSFIERLIASGRNQRTHAIDNRSHYQLARKTSEIIIAGHTHVAEVNDSLGYLNHGVFEKPEASWISIDKTGVAKLVRHSF